MLNTAYLGSNVNSERGLPESSRMETSTLLIRQAALKVKVHPLQDEVLRLYP